MLTQPVINVSAIISTCVGSLYLVPDDMLVFEKFSYITARTDPSQVGGDFVVWCEYRKVAHQNVRKSRPNNTVHPREKPRKFRSPSPSVMPPASLPP